jgi:hypothetical protein
MTEIPARRQDSKDGDMSLCDSESGSRKFLEEIIRDRILPRE